MRTDDPADRAVAGLMAKAGSADAARPLSASRDQRAALRASSAMKR